MTDSVEQCSSGRPAQFGYNLTASAFLGSSRDGIHVQASTSRQSAQQLFGNAAVLPVQTGADDDSFACLQSMALTEPSLKLFKAIRTHVFQAIALPVCTTRATLPFWSSVQDSRTAGCELSRV